MGAVDARLLRWGRRHCICCSAEALEAVSDWKLLLESQVAEMLGALELLYRIGTIKIIPMIFESISQITYVVL